MVRIAVETFSRIVEAIYDCALDPEKWRGTLPLIADLLESQGSTFAIHDTARGDGQRFIDHGIPEVAVRAYFERYAPLNPLITATSLFEIGEPITLRMTVPEQEYLESRFYREWAHPHHQGDLMGIVALRAGSRVATHALNRLDSQPDFNGDDIARYRLVAPHICRALTISDALNLKSVTSQMMEATLESLAAGVALVSSDLKVVYLNMAAERQVRTGTALTVASNRLLPSDVGAAKLLNEALKAATADEAQFAVGATSIALPAKPHAGLIATILPLGRGRRRSLSEPFSAAAAVFLQDPRAVVALPGEAFAKLYGLTPSELRVALAMAPGLQPKDIADLYGVSLATVKSHLAKIFAKTGTSRQSDLVALILRSSAPAAPR